MSGRRADDIETVIVQSGRRASDFTKTFGLVTSSAEPKRNRGFFTTIAILIGWFVLFMMGMGFLTSCCWMSILFW